MFTHKDIDARTIFVINCIEQDRGLRVVNGELFLEEDNNDEKKTLTKFPFQKILAIFAIGHISITTPLLDKCKKFNVALVVMKPNLRPVFWWSDSAEANYLLRRRQHTFAESDLSIARVLVKNKIENQRRCLVKSRKRDSFTVDAIDLCDKAAELMPEICDYNELMGIEGSVAKSFFMAYFQDISWHGRRPRLKCDELNVALDIGYTILFNFMESFVRMFGFDLYIGVYHRTWYKRKSLICDLIEPFRCIIDHSVLLAFHRSQFKLDDFERRNREYYLKRSKNGDYYKVFFSALIERRMEFFKYIQKYYRCFMGRKSVQNYPEYVFL